MQNKLLIAFLAVAFTAQAQVKPIPKPALICPKYQHVYHWPGPCGPAPDFCDAGTNACEAMYICTPVPPDKCVDDMHEVTEKEWQGIIHRLEALEFKAAVCGMKEED